MKLNNILLGRATRLLRIVGRPGGLYLKDAGKLLQERYGFVKVPVTLEEYDESKGVTFRHGKFTVKTAKGSRDIVIGQFQIYSNGLLVDTQSNTDDAESFLDDVLTWGVKNLEAVIPENQKTEKYFLSQLEFSLAKPLPSFFPPSALLGKEIAKHLKEYGIKHGPYEFVGFAMNFDRTTVSSIVSNFTLERREGVPLEDELYFSGAPLKTADHIALIEKLEQS